MKTSLIDDSLKYQDLLAHSYAHDNDNLLAQINQAEQYLLNAWLNGLFLGS